jgi:alpha-tubulin suppressor-like RCC1 family protein
MRTFDTAWLRRWAGPILLPMMLGPAGCSEPPADNVGDGVAAGALTADGQPCTLSSACQSGVCGVTSHVCATATCNDGVKNGAETSKDCGGAACPKCGGGATCKLGSDCQTSVCQANGYCSAAATCFDGVQNGTETGKDCGGSCAAGAACTTALDCATGVCSAATHLCATATCADGVQNGTETDVDCGGASCPACGDGKKCATVADCQGNGAGNGAEKPVCSATTTGGQTYCRQSTLCTNGVWDSAAGETDVDCGGACKPCVPPGFACTVGADCASGTCTLGACQTSSCQDGLKNGAETGVDCGGGACAPCGGGLPCKAGSDCTSGTCTSGFCTGPLDPCAGVSCPAPDACHFAYCSQGSCQTTAHACAASCQDQSFDPATMTHVGAGQTTTSGGWVVPTNGSVSTSLNLSAGQATVTVTAKGSVCQTVWPHLVVSLDGAPIGSTFVSTTSYTAYSFPLPAVSGAHQLSVAYDNDAVKAPEDRNLYLRKIEVGCGGANCSDGIKNGSEAGIDCGGTCPTACPSVDHCLGVTCTAQDQCHVAGTCIDHTTGACDNPAKADGTACNDGNASTTGDVCTAGVCAGVACSSQRYQLESHGSSTHMCLIELSSGAAYCWGSNDKGELGNGTKADSSVPTAVSGGHSFTSISSGYPATCGVTAAGAAYCWGLNGNGQLGNGTLLDSSTPAAVSGGLTFSHISSGGSRTCGITTAGAAYCWGSGPLGNGTTATSSVPVAVSGGQTFTQIEAGGWGWGWGTSCALTASGAAYCWGNNWYGSLGNGTNTDSSVPVAVSGGHTFASITIGTAGACGLTTAGAAYCWGHQSVLGLAASGSNASVPIPVGAGHTFTSLSAGNQNVCGVTPGGAVYCWGYGAPALLGGSYSFTQIATGLAPCGLTAAGGVACWGDNSWGELGRLHPATSALPLPVNNLPGGCVSCGDGVCSVGESCGSCPADCGTCAYCGDGTCNNGESVGSCPADCAVCGDGLCTGAETSSSCPQDCYCGNGVCDGAESLSSCPGDCSVCGDGLCTGAENVYSCQGDCSVCGDGICSGAEDINSCVMDCSVCGDGICSGAEDAFTCPADCDPCLSAYASQTLLFCTCGDGICNGVETTSNCPSDCYCGDGLCFNGEEDVYSCPGDCAYCGDGVCSPGEDSNWCGDCFCGDGVCSPGEDSSSCPTDCP